MLLSKNLDLFKQIIKDTADDSGVPSRYIEKDFYAISTLRGLVKRNENFVFKGGTSLSVCQKIINRFSEDIDISYAEEHITVGQRRQIKQAFFDSISDAGLTLTNGDNIRSRRIFNRYLCYYDTQFGGDSTVIVEWATQTPSFPIEIKQAQTMVGKYLTEIGRFDLIEKYELQPFNVKTITKLRTLVDKTFAICDYHISKKLDRQSRHIYDIYQLLKCVELNDEYIDVFLRVKSYREQLDTCYSVMEKRVISDLLNELVEQDTYKEDYQLRTYPLLYDNIKYEDCLPSIKRISKFLKEHNL